MIPTKAVVISCEETPERLEGFHERWNSLHLDLPLGEYVTHLDREDPRRGCWQSHLSVMKSSNEPTFILEDDAIFSPAFTLEIEVPDDWDLLYYGGRHFTNLKGPVKPIKSIYTNHGYVVRDPQRVVPMIDPPVIGRHLSGTLGRRVRLKRYVVNPQTVGQKAGISLTTGKIRKVDTFFGS